MRAWLAVLGVALAVMASAGCVKGARFTCADGSECVRDGVTGTCESVGFCSFPDPSCTVGGRRFGDSSGPYAGQCVDEPPDAGIIVDAPPDMFMHDAFPSACAIPSGAIHAWTLNIPLVADFNVQSDVPYAVDNRGALATTVFSRVAYCLQLDATYVYTELDDFTGGMIADTGIPTDNIFKVAVTRLTVRTNSAAVTEVTNASGGLIEMWPNCYTVGTNDVHDYDDTTTSTDCYGSFQVHHNTTTVLAYNRWSSSGENSDVGIGNRTTSNPDWTFAANAADYTTRTLQAFVLP